MLDYQGTSYKSGAMSYSFKKLRSDVSFEFVPN